MHYTGKQQGHAARCFCALGTVFFEIDEDGRLSGIIYANHLMRIMLTAK
ncbi:hypothetical protein GGR96_001076 [Thalassospira tepidiphila]|uniref:Uncharacterized protein n=1 Tax=Thalassospira tepidiphila TaxID=393657 RepID=A0ABX0WXF6_9PROT|nr:hypothetical protein [Thalassospira tepidiphila]